MSMRRATFGFLVLLVPGCLSSEQLLEPDGSPAAPWENLSAEEGGAVHEGAHRDACADPNPGSLCVTHDSTGGTGMMAMCLDGSLLRSSLRLLTREIPDGECADGVLLESHAVWNVHVGSPGCLRLAACEGTGGYTTGYAGVYELCPAPMVSGLRPGAESIAPWTECAATLAGGEDGDPCLGSAICAGDQVTPTGGTTNPLLTWCDDGVLRTYAPPLSPMF